MTLSYRIIDEWDNGEFLTGATLVYLEDGREIGRETFHGSTEFAPGYLGTQLAVSAGDAWLECATTTLSERLAPFGVEWQREQEVPF